MLFECFDDNRLAAQLSGERFTVTYLLSGSEALAREKAECICVEQTVEFPLYLLPEGRIPGEIVGKIVSFEKAAHEKYRLAVSYAVEIVSGEITQFINVLFGNSSILPGIFVERFDLGEGMLPRFKGPRLGMEKMRELLGEPESPLVFSVLKPMGLSAEDFAGCAYRMAKGGIHIIKDDHSLADQSFAPFEERVQRCGEAVAKANNQTGGRTIYVPNVSAPGRETFRRARYAKEHGAGGLLVIPGLVGFGTMQELALDDEIDLPVFCHPAFLGSYLVNEGGFSCACLLGQLARLAGADASIFPNFIGRFPLSKEQCVSIQAAGRVPMGGLKTMFACPAGGMSAAALPKALEAYGKDVMLLMGGGLFDMGPDLEKNSRTLVGLIKDLI
jgi:ribulose-bisphosphate carboxylase large chain